MILLVLAEIQIGSKLYMAANHIAPVQMDVPESYVIAFLLPA